jgi:hypothetical protein
VLVRLDVDVLPMRHAQGTIAGSSALVGGGMAVGGLAGVGMDPMFLLLGGVGAGVAGLGHLLGRSVYRNRVGEIESALGGVLDRVEHHPIERRR